MALTVDEVGGSSAVESVYVILGGQVGGFGPVSSAGSSGGNILGIQLELVPEDQRNISAAEFARIWRRNTGDIAGIENELPYPPEGAKPESEHPPHAVETPRAATRRSLFWPFRS